MATLSLSHNGANAPVPLGSYAGTLTAELHDSNGSGVSIKTITTQVTAQHTLGSLAAGLATLLNVPGKVIDLVIVPQQ